MKILDLSIIAAIMVAPPTCIQQVEGANNFHKVKVMNEAEIRLSNELATVNPDSLRERLLCKVIRTITGCWEWKGYKNASGYGVIWNQGKPCSAHRVSFETFVGPVPKGQIVRHEVCGNRCCVNPEHLKPGTPKENRQDMRRHGRGIAGDLHYSKRHPEKVARGPKPGGEKRRGVLSSRTPFNESQIVEIRKLYAAGTTTLRELGKRFGVSNVSVYKIVRRKTWTHI